MEICLLLLKYHIAGLLALNPALLAPRKGDAFFLPTFQLTVMFASPPKKEIFTVAQGNIMLLPLLFLPPQ